MRKQLSRALLLSSVLAVVTTGLAADTPHKEAQEAPPPYVYATNGVLDNIQGVLGARWKLLLDKTNLGGQELEAAEVTLPAGTTVPGHSHGSVEVIYVLSGTYDHEVNGKLYRLKPGMVGIVRPGDQVRHLVPKDGDVKLLILWAPAGEAARAFARAQGTTPAPVPEAHR
jgi:quercetin dioxygenase-like cupin family protein